MSELVKVAMDEGIARLTLNRPDVGNSIDSATADALLDAVVAVAEDEAVRVVVITGAGRMFCAGGDVRAFATVPGSESGVIARITAPLHAAINRLAQMDKPLVTMINGPAAGAGLGLALLGDIVIAARSAHFTSAYTAIGLSPDGGTSWLLPRVVGLRKAQEMILTNRRVTADEALAIGMVTQVTDDDALEEVVAAVAARLSSAPTAALGRSRRLLLISGSHDLAAHLEEEALEIAASASSDDGRNGIAAFLARQR